MRRIAAIALVALASVSVTRSSSASLPDAETVWCSEEGQQVIRAGVDLGLVSLPKDNSQVSRVVLNDAQKPAVGFDKWKVQEPATYERACRAAFRAGGNATLVRLDLSGGEDDIVGPGLISAVLGALAGGGLGYAGSRGVQSRQWRRELQGEATVALFDLIAARDAIAASTSSAGPPADVVEKAERAADRLMLALQGLAKSMPPELERVRQWSSKTTPVIEREGREIERAVREELGFEDESPVP